MSFWVNKRVLITGFNGYLGRELGRTLLAQGAAVVGADLKTPSHYDQKITYETCQLLDVEKTIGLLKKYEIETCFHLAGLSGVSDCQKNPIAAFETNCRLTWCFLEACRTYGKMKEIVATSSNHVYGHQKELPSSENAQLSPDGSYGVSKACGDYVARLYAESYRLPVGIARITNSFGGDDPHSTHLITGTITSLLNGKNPVIKGNGTATKGFLYVKDTIRGLIAFAENMVGKNLAGEVINFAPNESMTVLQVVKEIMQVMGKTDLTPHILGDPSQKEEKEHLSNQKAKIALGWTPTYTFREAVSLAVQDLQSVIEKNS